ncbi:SRPBCC family protein [Saccharothrix australiensis]|uniref:Polyketide cyclase/dehydrase/lipid transport protein n=1 Tax=Saccharothrix australiensis TaxID=2072 RepID=A0A495W662_9PSEU|nr:SRPBCC family protein [Saccharothrix australiensis]RKT55288.1 polyketide cyclase/dehydrase/lipid transport protein [Saccharothrix australiensis]
MSSYEHRAAVDLAPDRLFDFLAEPKNLPRYFPELTEVDPVGGDRVHVEADLGDRHVAADGWLRVDRDRRTLSWGTPGETDYHGELSVTGQDAGRSEIVVTLHTERAGGPEIQRSLEEAVAVLAHRATAETDAAAAEKGDEWY